MYIAEGKQELYRDGVTIRTTKPHQDAILYGAKRRIETKTDPLLERINRGAFATIKSALKFGLLTATGVVLGLMALAFFTGWGG